MMNITNCESGGVGFFDLLALAFIILKLTNLIDWSWLWVLSPFWITAIIAAVVWIIKDERESRKW